MKTPRERLESVLILALLRTHCVSKFQIERIKSRLLRQDFKELLEKLPCQRSAFRQFIANLDQKHIAKN